MKLREYLADLMYVFVRILGSFLTVAFVAALGFGVFMVVTWLKNQW